jgi:hypothetical protein
VKKVLLMIDCDSCRRLYEYTRTASEDTSAWWVHGNAVAKMAMRDGWARSADDNFHYCPECLDECDEDMCLQFD